MIALIQILKALSKFNRDLVEAYFDGIDKNNAEEEIELLPEFLLTHCGIDVELTDLHKSSMVRIVKSGSYKSVFKTIDIAF